MLSKFVISSFVYFHSLRPSVKCFKLRLTYSAADYSSIGSGLPLKWHNPSNIIDLIDFHRNLTFQWSVASHYWPKWSTRPSQSPGRSCRSRVLRVKVSRPRGQRPGGPTWRHNAARGGSGPRACPTASVSITSTPPPSLSYYLLHVASIYISHLYELWLHTLYTLYARNITRLLGYCARYFSQMLSTVVFYFVLRYRNKENSIRPRFVSFKIISLYLYSIFLFCYRNNQNSIRPRFVFY